MGETKFRKKMYKSGKFWVAAGMTALTVGVVNPQFMSKLSKDVDAVFAAQTTSTQTIDTVTDADANGRYVVWNKTGINDNDAVAGKGTYNGTAWSAEYSSYADPSSQTYSKLTANGSNTIGYYYLTRQFDASQKFTIDGYFHPNLSGQDGKLPSHGNWSDWVGLVLTPTDPNKMATDYNMNNGGGGLGIQGFGNALGLDFYQNSGDPAAGPFGALRTTSSSGALNTVPDALYTKGINMTNWSTTIKYQLTYWPTGGPGGGPYITASFTDNANSSNKWTVNTNTAGVTINPPKAFSVGVNAANGQKAQDNFASIDNLSGTFATGTTTVKYVDANGNAIKDPTTFVAGVGDVIGITNLSTQAKAATTSSGTYKDAVGGKTGGTINFGTTDSNLPKSGYTYTVTGPDNITYSNLSSAVAANSFDNTDNKVAGVQASSDKSYQYFTVNYTPATQTTSLVVDSNSPVKAGSVLASSLGATSATISLPYTDASLSTAGYSYVVKGPNGSNYSTLSSAVAANSLYDATNNTGTTDSSAQVFTVSYVAQYQAAALRYDASGPISAGSTKATASGTTGGTIAFAGVTDSNLASAGYTYTVKYMGTDAPDSTAYTTLSSAVAGTPTL